jgi:hypothetical protein
MFDLAARFGIDRDDVREAIITFTAEQLQFNWHIKHDDDDKTRTQIALERYRDTGNSVITLLSGSPLQTCGNNSGSQLGVALKILNRVEECWQDDDLLVWNEISNEWQKLERKYLWDFVPVPGRAAVELHRCFIPDAEDPDFVLYFDAVPAPQASTRQRVPAIFKLVLVREKFLQQIRDEVELARPETFQRQPGGGSSPTEGFEEFPENPSKSSLGVACRAAEGEPVEEQERLPGKALADALGRTTESSAPIPTDHPADNLPTVPSDSKRVDRERDSAVSLTRKRQRGPKRGATGFSAADFALCPGIDNIVKSGEARSAIAAARILVKMGKVASSGGSDENRANRLARRYGKWKSTVPPAKG